jgi:purine-nucleoside phosphorylase
MIADPPHAAAERVRRWLGPRRPDVAIVLGSGLGAFAERLHTADRLPYAEIPGFPTASVPGHTGELVVGTLGARPVLCQSGRFHGFEGVPAETAVLPVRVFAALGVRRLIVTNAAGGIRRSLRPGTLMRIADHLNLTFCNPLIGPVRPGELRFPDMSAPYDPGLAARAHRAASETGVALEVGVYAGVRGPSYETPAEIRMLERLGADAVGMSTVMEVITARAAGIHCLGISTITNAAAGLGHERLTHHDVVAVAGESAAALGRLLAAIVTGLGDQDGPDAGSRAGTI